jgi:hypothetical protein
MVHRLLGMDNFYAPYQKYIKELSPDDIGKAIVKVAPSPLSTGATDYSYIGETHTLVDIQKRKKSDTYNYMVVRCKSGVMATMDNAGFLYGWVLESDIIGVRPNTKISKDHIDDLKRMERA